MRIGQSVKVVKQVFGKSFIGRTGKITSIGHEVLPVHVTLTGERHETDFKPRELRVLRRTR